MKKIIFICKHNVFRSRVAEEYFKKTNKNKNVTAISRGLIMGGKSDEAQQGAAKDLLGVNIKGRGPKGLTIPEKLAADYLVVVADDIPKVIFDYQRIPLKAKVLIWGVPDEQRKNRKNLTKTVLMIKRKVDELNNKLKNTK